MHVPLIFLSQWREFPSAPSLAGKKTWWQLASWWCRNRARRLTCLLSASVTRKITCNSAHEQTPLSNDTIDSVLRHREVGEARVLPAPLVIELVRAMTPLSDQRHKSYYNTDLKPKLWDEKGKKFNAAGKYWKNNTNEIGYCLLIYIRYL